MQTHHADKRDAGDIDIAAADRNADAQCAAQLSTYGQWCLVSNGTQARSGRNNDNGRCLIVRNGAAVAADTLGTRAAETTPLVFRLHGDAETWQAERPARGLRPGAWRSLIDEMPTHANVKARGRRHHRRRNTQRHTKVDDGNVDDDDDGR